MAKADLLLKLSYMKDECTVEKVQVGGRIKFFFNTISTKLSAVFKVNILYVLIFCLPLIFVVVALPIILENMVMDQYYFAGNFGIGYPGNQVSVSVAITELYSWYYKLLLPLIFPSIFIAVFGLSGVSHCARGFMWGEKVKPARSFFRGIKALYKPFLILAFVLAAIATGAGYAIIWQINLLALGTATAGSWVLFIFVILLCLFVITILVYLIPLFSCYRFTFMKSLKNALILDAVYWLQALMLAILCGGFFLLLMVNVLNILFGMLLIMVGIVCVIAAWTTWSQAVFTMSIEQLQLSSEKGYTVTAKKARDERRASGEENANQTAQGIQNKNKQQKKPQNNYKPSYKKSNNKGKK